VQEDNIIENVTMKEIEKNFQEIGTMHVWCKEIIVNKFKQSDFEQKEKENK